MVGREKEIRKDDGRRGMRRGGDGWEEDGWTMMREWENEDAWRGRGG